jgi:hypothetical protein
MRRILVPIVLSILVLPLLRAQEPAKSEKTIKDDVSIQQELLARRFKDFEQALLRLAQRLEASDKPENREKAVMLKKAIQLAGERGADAKFDTLVRLLRESKELGLEDLQKVLDENKSLAKDIRDIIAILMTDNRDAELKAERERLEALLKQLGTIIREQKLTRADTERGKTSAEKLGKSQAQVREATEKLANAMAKKGDGKSGDSKSGDSKSGDSKSGDSKSGDSKSGSPKSGSPKSGDPKSGDPKAGDPKQNGDQQQNQQQGRPQVQEATKHQREAEKNIAKKDNPKASNDQDKAIQELEKAKAELEKLLAQLREEEKLRQLAALQQRCERMLQMQIAVRDATVNVYKTIQDYPDKKATRTEVQKTFKLSDDEEEIAKEAQKAINLLQAEGSAVAFPEVFLQIQTDMRIVSGRLRKTDVDVVTQTIEQDIIDTLKEMIEALKKQQNAIKNNQNKPGSSQQQDSKLIELLAELKMIRSLQIRINSRTKVYAAEYQGEQAPNPLSQDTPEQREKAAMVQRELKNLAERQLKVVDAVSNIAKGKAEATGN